LAAAFAAKYPVVILDADPQQSAAQWYEIAEHKAAVEVFNASGNLKQTIKEVENDFTYCLIDCPPSVQSSQMQLALRVANMAIIPVQPSPIDLWATVHVEKEVALAGKQNPALKTLLLINQLESRTQLSRLMHRALAELSLPAAETSIKRRVVYKKSFLEGRTVHDMGRRGDEASDEIHQLIQEMEEYL
jgi:chromosome partitioning protein